MRLPVKSEIGPLLFANSWFSVLGRGVTSSSGGKIHDSIEVLRVDVITRKIV